ncbi:MAG: SHOCT domain-containing protein [Paraglaciecola sp.]|uniref:SHOCT domain-containing protein n=1 Tax=Paraglaciecola sp. TaxID=1920173 RepID=UPI0032991FD5
MAFITNTVQAEEYQIELLADFSHLNQTSNDTQWLNPLAGVIDDEYFLAQDNGIVYLIRTGESNKQNAILNISIHNPSFISLSAISLHPSFSLPEEPGYATFYTAHTVKFSPEKFANRVAVEGSSLAFGYESVITAWTYDFEKHQLDPKTQREVLRIPIPSPNHGIQQLKFEPYLKPWNANYGLLYFSLKYVEQLKEYPLYSGGILRISPLIFGARNYTVSQTNPFLKTPEINDEIVVMGGHDITHFFWAKYSHESIFIHHYIDKQHWLSKSRIGVNLQEQSLSDNLWLSPNEISSSILYQGRKFLSLRNKMVFFTQHKNQWQLNSIGLDSLNIETPTIEKVIGSEQIPTNSHLIIHQNNHNEIVIFDTIQSKLYLLQPTNVTVIDEKSPEPDLQDLGSKYVILLVLLLAVLGVAFIYTFRKNAAYKRAIYPLDKGYVRFEYELRKETVHLFKIKQKKAHKTLHVKEISRCEILLNNQSIRVFDEQPGNAISNRLEEDIRNLFTKEHDKKMQEDQTRQIEVILSDSNGSYTICLYLRKGNNRVTGNKYFNTVDIVLDLCWMVSKHINSFTETRAITKVPFSRPNLEDPTRHVRKQQSDHPIKKEQPASQPSEPEDSAPTIQESPAATAEKQQTDVVDALEKLVKLHAQGHLTDEEFSLAKSNLLQ